MLDLHGLLLALVHFCKMLDFKLLVSDDIIKFILEQHDFSQETCNLPEVKFSVLLLTNPPAPFHHQSV